MKTAFTHFTVLALLAGISFTHAQSDAHSAITPVPRTGGWTNRANLLDQRLKDTPDTQVLFIGDSITQGWEGGGAKEVWARNYDKYKAVNLGIGGDRTQHVLWRLQNAPLDGVKPKAAVVMIGTNNSNGEDNTPGEIADGIAAIVKMLRERLPGTKVLLLGIFPRGENFNPQRGKIAQVNQVLPKLADGQNVFYLDIGHHFLELDGHLSTDIMPDYLHLSTKGYELWAKALEGKLGELVSGTK